MTDALDARITALEHRFELTDLIARYSMAVDDHDLDTVLGCFTEDGEFVRAGQVVSGHAALRTFYQAMFDRYRLTIHTPNAQVLHRLSPTEATGVATGHAELAYQDTLMLAAYRYDDVYARLHGSWKFRRRDLQFLYVLPADQVAGSFRDRDRIRWPDQAPAPADLPESLPPWSGVAAASS